VNPTNLTDLETREIIPGFRAKFIHTDNITLTYWDITSGASLPEHSHPNEQVSSLIEGEFILIVGKKTHHLKPGSVMVIPPDVPHSGQALTDCRIIDVFYPKREDYA